MRRGFVRLKIYVVLLDIKILYVVMLIRKKQTKKNREKD